MPIVPADPQSQTSPQDTDQTTEAPSSDNKPKYRTRTRPTERSLQGDVASGEEKPKTDENENEVGYCKPPKSGQFKKGQSGNPKGRPKGSKNVSSILKEVINEKVVVRESGKRHRVTKIEAIIKQMVNKASTGDPRATKQLMDFLRTHLGEENAASAGDAVAQERSPAEIDADDKAILADFLRIHSVPSSPPGGDND